MVKISKKALIFFILVLFFLFYVKFFYLINLPGRISNFVDQSYSGIFALIICLITLSISREKYKFKNWLLFFYLFLLLETLISVIRYPMQSFSDTMLYSSQYLILLLYIPLSASIKNDTDLKRIINLFALITIYISIMMLLQYRLYSLTGTVSMSALNNHFIQWSVSLKNGSLRVYHVMDGLSRISIILSFWLIINKRNILSIFEIVMHISNFVFGILAVYFVDQSRIYFVSMVVVLYLIVFTNTSNSGIKKWLSITAAVFLASVIFFNAINLTLNNLLSTISDSNDGSSAARLGAIGYFFVKAIGNPLLGIGIINNNEYLQIARGPFKIYNYDDVGLFGILGQFGFLGLAWYIGIIVKHFSIVRSNKGRFIPLNFVLSIAILLNCLTQSYMDSQRLIILPIELAIMEHLYKTE